VRCDTAIRSLLKAREFTLVAVAIIAIGIGANTAVFSIVDAALLRPLPFRTVALFMLAGVNAKRGDRRRAVLVSVVRRAGGARLGRERPGRDRA
jgi:hypothetical protein